MLTNTEGNYDLNVTVKGGGTNGQVGKQMAAGDIVMVIEEEDSD